MTMNSWCLVLTSLFASNSPVFFISLRFVHLLSQGDGFVIISLSIHAYIRLVESHDLRQLLIAIITELDNESEYDKGIMKHP